MIDMYNVLSNVDEWHLEPVKGNVEKNHNRNIPCIGHYNSFK